MGITGDWDGAKTSRRGFLALGGASVVALALGGRGAIGARLPSVASAAAGFGELAKDPGGVCDLPDGFQYRILSPAGAKLSDGRPVPAAHDGMAAFDGGDGRIALVRNHELTDAEDGQPVVGKNPFDKKAAGGTTGLVVGPDRRLVESFVTSAGTYDNCAGGPTPWGTWLTCEEERSERHGRVFEVMWDDPENALSKTPIRGLGFFEHEAAAVDPQTGVVYLTEDDGRGVIARDPKLDKRRSFLYRFLPDNPLGGPGSLQKGGKLQALALTGASLDADFYGPGDRVETLRWIDVGSETAAEDAIEGDGLRFNRLEGCDFDQGAFWFADTVGGEARLGQIFRYTPGTNGRPDSLELFYEGTKRSAIDWPDNITVTPWGDLWFAEDGGGVNRVMGVTPEGEVYAFARTGLSEFAGPCFSPDGETFFVNIQEEPGQTLAIWGPFPEPSTARRRRLAVAPPPSGFVPGLDDDLLEASRQAGLSPYEAAALRSFGVPAEAR